MNLLSWLCSDMILDKAYIWCCRQRESIPINQDIWYLCQNWFRIKSETGQLIFDGEYKFSSLQKHEHEGTINLMLSMRDAIVVKAIAIILNAALIAKLSNDCTNLSNHTDVCRVVKFVNNMLNKPCILICGNISEDDALKEREHLLRQINYLTDDPTILNLIEQFLDLKKSLIVSHHQFMQGLNFNTVSNISSFKENDIL